MLKFLTVHSTNAKFADIWKNNVIRKIFFILWRRSILVAVTFVNHDESSFAGLEYKTELIFLS